MHLSKEAANLGDLFIGVMSGTSFDGVDLVLLDVERPFRARQLAFQCKLYPAAIRTLLLEQAGSVSWHPDQLLALHDALGSYFGQIIKHFLEMNPTDRPIRAIGLHGQTLWHTPAPTKVGTLWGRGTLQLGNPFQVRALTGVPTIYDFRAADMALGGQGAPLVPFLDQLLFADAKLARMALNLGGIANITFLPAGGGPVVAFDTGPGNMLMDALMAAHPETPMPFDRDGGCAAQGRVIAELLAHCKADSYFKKAPPKSTGRERFGHGFLEYFQRDWGDVAYADLVATAARLTAETIADAIHQQRQVMRQSGSFETLIIAGGGTSNPILMKLIGECLPGVKIQTTQAFGVHPDAKEAWLMAALAWAHLEGIPANLPSVTGARRAVVLGARTP